VLDFWLLATGAVVVAGVCAVVPEGGVWGFWKDGLFGRGVLH
jgi:hypothetical protein